MKKGQKKSTPYKLIKLRCRNCNNIVERYKCRMKQFKYCCSKCREEARKNRVSKKKIDYTKLVLCTCKNDLCNKKVKLVPSLAKRFRYCSRYCMYRVIRKEKTEKQVSVILNSNPGLVEENRIEKIR